MEKARKLRATPESVKFPRWTIGIKSELAADTVALQL
jgi:hypothetical protein